MYKDGKERKDGKIRKICEVHIERRKKKKKRKEKGV